MFIGAGYIICMDLTLCLLSFVNLDQVRRKVKIDLDPNYYAFWWYSWKKFCENVYFEEKNQQMTKKHAKLQSMQNVNP